MKNKPNWMTYWDNVDIGLYALIKHVKKQNKMSKKQLQGEPIPLAYYGRHHLPAFKRNRVTTATKINRSFYKNLRNIGRTHKQIIKMIQPERRKRFLRDVQYLYNAPEVSFIQKLLNRIKRNS